MENNITFHAMKIGNYRIHNQYFILSGSKQIGEIIFTIKNKVFIIGFCRIYKEYRNQYYGYKIIEYILSHYKINCIIGETLNESKGFWNKCIKKFNGQRKNISLYDNCSSSFVIPNTVSIMNRCMSYWRLLITLDEDPLKREVCI